MHQDAKRQIFQTGGKEESGQRYIEKWPWKKIPKQAFEETEYPYRKYQAATSLK